MSFAGSTAVNLITDNGLNGGLPGVYVYRSSDSSTSIIGTGYFAGMGRSFNKNISLGGPLVVGDIILNIESSGGATPGRVTFHGVKSSTSNSTSATISTTAALDCTVTASCTA
jgi:hypothetical protein